MSTDEMDEHNAKLEVLRLDKILTEPVLLIGGLAVQRYVYERKSKDIDIVCDLKTQKQLLEEAYGDPNFEKREKQTDLRPVYEIRDNLTGNVVYLGAKIKERDPYPYINYEILFQDSEPFRYNDSDAENVRIPAPHALAFSKLISFIARRGTEKGLRDLEDFSKLTNIRQFSLNNLIALSQRLNATAYIQDFFRNNSFTDEELNALAVSSLVRLKTIIPLELLPNIAERGHVSIPVFGPVDSNFRLRSVEIEMKYKKLAQLEYTKTKRLTATKNNIGSFYDQYHWTGDSDVEISCVDQNHIFRERAPKNIWRRYEVDFQRILKEGDEEDVSIVWKVGNKEGAFTPFISTTIDNPTDRIELVLDASTVKAKIGRVQVDVLPSLGVGEPIEQIEIDGSDGVFRYECENPRLLHTYEMRWNMIG